MVFHNFARGSPGKLKNYITVQELLRLLPIINPRWPPFVQSETINLYYFRQNSGKIMILVCTVLSEFTSMTEWCGQNVL